MDHLGHRRTVDHNNNVDSIGYNYSNGYNNNKEIVIIIRNKEIVRRNHYKEVSRQDCKEIYKEVYERI